MIKEVLENWVVNLPPKEYKHLSPSSLGGCPRVHYFKLRDVPMTTPPKASALLNFQVGFLWETIFEEALKYSGLKFESQKELLSEKYNIGGTLDFLDDTPEGTEIWDSKKWSVVLSMNISLNFKIVIAKLGKILRL